LFNDWGIVESWAGARFDMLQELPIGGTRPHQDKSGLSMLQ